MDALFAFFDLLWIWMSGKRYVIWALVAFIVVGLIAVAANVMEPGRPSF
jgi:hypothetical protein